MISLGCAKNLVDSEIMLGHLRQAGMDLTPNANDADVIIVNTCAFIDSAKEESIEAILDSHKERGMTKRTENQKLIVAGCMSQRFSKDLRNEMPEVDAFIGLDQLTDVAGIVKNLIEREKPADNMPLNLVTPKPVYIPDYNTPRFRLTPASYSFVKIAEGCNHPCSFCVIPQMRGRHRSRTIDSVKKEVQQLVKEGVKEINLISQDTTYYGMDRWEEKAGPRQQVDPSRGETLIHLLEELETIEGDFWIRLLYTHPAHWSPQLIEFMGRSKKTARYIDIPLQHIHDDMLKSMRRETSSQHIRDLIKAMRAGIPGLGIRTTFIVGFPGETEENFETLMDFIQETRFERLGVFKYSQEEGSRAAKMEGQLEDVVKKQRFHKAMTLQKKLAKEIAAAKVGKTFKVLAENENYGRTEHDAPEVDCRVLFKKPRQANQFYDITIGSHNIYDLSE
jgi:ribosomal protein S12 methylthiotransferase